MQLTSESPRTRWLLLFAAWGVCALAIGLHTRTVTDYVTVVDRLGLRDAPAAATPHQQVIPARFADAQMWVRHARAGRDAGETRVRFTRVDNAPHGREVHWASPLAWLIRLSDTLGNAERTLLWFNAPLLLALIMLFSGWAAQRAGAGAGVLVAVAMVGHNRFYDSFAPANVDHHGLLTASVFGLVLGLVFMGAGWWKPNLGGTFTTLLPSDAASTRRAAVVSAVSGALGVWVSAASVLPAIALAGAAGLIVAWWRGPAALRDGARFDPGAWQLWGGVGGGLAGVCYLIEYAPHHLHLRLEVNHPLYSLAWWGGGGLVALLGARVAERGQARGWGRLGLQLFLPGLAVAAVPVVMLAGGDQVFALRDPFIAELRHYVLEGKTLPEVARTLGFGAVAYQLGSGLLLVPAFALAGRARGEGAVLAGFATLVAAAFLVLGFWEVRWWFVGSATQIVLLLTLLAINRRPWTWVLLVAAVLLLPAAFARIAAVRSDVRAGIIDARDILQPLYRDLAAALRAAQPDGDIVLLASPNASAGIGYFGNFKSLGTLFWENTPGLKAAAAIYSARTDEEAARLIRARGVTHVVVIPTASFHVEYFQLLHPGAPGSEISRTFGHRLLAKQPDIPWLQPIPYRKPPDLDLAPAGVRLYRVAFEVTEEERRFQMAVALVAAGDLAEAETAFAELAALVPAESRAELHETAASVFYDYGADAPAVRAFRRALELNPTANATTTLAWILATTADNTLRDGFAALSVISPVARAEPGDPTVLSALAAALAETGRFPEAVAEATKALEAARAAGDREASALLERRLATYRSGKAWRQ
jgi:tetratricopeptide (TPR) repeat protein